MLPNQIKHTVLAFLFFSCTITFAQKDFNFTSLGNNLINNEVTAIQQDRNGFLWIGTRGGLIRYDGYDYKQLKTDFGKGDDIQSQSIEVLHNGLHNELWIGTKSGGVSSYNIATGSIKNYKNNNLLNKDFNADYILSFLDIDSVNLLVGTWKGLQVLNKLTGKFTILNSSWKTFDIKKDETAKGYWLATNVGLLHLNEAFKNDFSLTFGLQSVDITSIVFDKQKNCLWLGSWGHGIFKLQLSNNKFFNFMQSPNNVTTISSNNAYKLLLDSRNNLWIGTWGGGLNKFDPTTEKFENVPLYIPGAFTGDNKIVLMLHEDASGLLWVGTDGLGVFKQNLNQKPFRNIGNTNRSNAFIGNTHVLSVLIDSFNKLWVGTKNSGVQTTIKVNNLIKTNSLALNNKNEDLVYSSKGFLQDSIYMWIATEKGLRRVENNKNSVKNVGAFLPNSKDKYAIGGKKITTLVKDSDGKIWIGTQENGLSCITGYNKFKYPLFKNYFPNFGVEGALQNERVSCLLVDSKKRLWVGTYKGLHLYNKNQDNFRVFFQNSSNKYSLSNNTILCLAEDNWGNIWVGTQHGLNKIKKVENNTVLVDYFTAKDGFNNDYIHAIIPDYKQNIWVSTNNGIVKFNSLTKKTTLFDKRDGLISNHYSENAFFKSKNGEFYFGSVDGITHFYPDSIYISKYQPPLFFTNLKVNNLPVEYGNNNVDTNILTKPFAEVESIQLSYQDNIFSISFSALDFHAPDKNEYMYKLEGFNKEWVYAGKDRQISFTNLEAGKYYLKIKGTNSDKVWSNNIKQLEITILPPPWKTWWAYSIYITIFILLLWLTRYLGLRQQALKNQLLVAKIDSEQEKKIAHFKEELFTNISHEFRTPLTLILGPIDDLLVRKKMDFTIEKSIRMVQKQSKRMLRMVNQLLDFQKAEAGSLKLQLQPGELVSFCYDVFTLFKDEAERRNIKFTFSSSEKFISSNFDFNKLEIIVYNLLSNAFKYLANGKNISLCISKQNESNCQILVIDDGKGIDSNEINHVFDRFFRGKEVDATNISGTGIGLSFVKDLVVLHGGSIEAKNNDVIGSTFIITLPIQLQTNTNFNAANILANNNDSNIFSNTNSNDMLDQDEQSIQELELPIILVVEDDIDIQEYIYEILSPTFKVKTANNGKEGLQLALEIIPDLIVSDIMMPEMDGIEMCKQLKANKDTSHIPVILLTALTDMAHHVQGIQEGADVYLPKPFNSQLLLVHIHNLINLRNTLKDLYAKKVLLGTNNFEIKSYEEEFLFSLMQKVEENISNANFNNDELAACMYMSRSTFYRKLKAVTGMSGNEFIRTSRLNHAAKLLKSGNYSVAETAMLAGFNDIKYFRKRFQEQFGVTPSDLKK